MVMYTIFLLELEMFGGFKITAPQRFKEGRGPRRTRSPICILYVLYVHFELPGHGGTEFWSLVQTVVQTI